MPIRELETGSAKELRFEYTVRGKRVGAISLHKLKRGGRMVWGVMGIHVLASHQRKGVGTKLWERAARAACEKGAPLASFERIGEMSQPFWDKQIRKGRASLLCKRCGTGKTPVYTLSCPAPRSLKGRKG